MSPETSQLIYTAQTIIKQATRYRKLSRNSAEWGRQIQDALYNEHRQLNGRKIQTIWESKDDITGNAVGRVVVDNKVAIPVIVDDHKLAPLDTFTDSNAKPRRISPSRLKKALFNPDLFGGIITPQDERGLMPDVPLYRSYGVLPWEEGRRTFANAKYLDILGPAKFEKLCSEDPQSLLVGITKIAMNADEELSDLGPSLLRRMLEYAADEDIAKVAAVLNANPQVVVNLHTHGCADLISEILNTQPQTIQKMAEDAFDQLPASVAQLRMVDGQVTMKVASDGVYAPQEVILPRERFEATLRTMGVEDTRLGMAKAASPMGLTVSFRSNNHRPVFSSDLKAPAAIDKFGHYVVKDLAGREYQGYVFPKFYSLSKASMSQALFLSPDLNVIQAKIAGVPAPVAEEGLPSTLPETGDTGIFVYEKGAEAIALEPVVIKQLEKSAGEVQINAETLMGLPVRFHLSKSAKDLVQLPADKGHAFLLPLSMKFARLNNLAAQDLLVGDATSLAKMATADHLGPNTVRITSPVDGRLFLFQGKIADQMGISGMEQYPDEAVFKLACMGLSGEVAEEILNRATKTGSVVIGNLRPVLPAQEAFSQEKRAAHMQMLATLPGLKKDIELLLKIAADTQDPASVDRILSLCVLNPQNMGILVDHMGDLENTGVRLSEMLLASRLGAKDMNESALIQARQAIDDVLDGLANLRSRLGPQTATEETGGSAE